LKRKELEKLKDGEEMIKEERHKKRLGKKEKK
jgi:hypothetical protein